MQVDAQRLMTISLELAELLQVPWVIIISFSFFFYNFGYYFFAGLGVFVLAVLFNFILGIEYGKQESIILRRKDRRMKVTTESINNIKMLKLYAWQDSFLERALRRRGKELVTLRKINIIEGLYNAGIFFFPSILPAVTFTAYVGTGHTIDL